MVSENLRRDPISSELSTPIDQAANRCQEDIDEHTRPGAGTLHLKVLKNRGDGFMHGKNCSAIQRIFPGEMCKFLGEDLFELARIELIEKGGSHG